jgi:putative oxygen-independent coproporphyrinogen III oxidase
MHLEAPPLALYLHFPWCVSKCPYCDFNSHALKGELPQREYLAALLADLDAQCGGGDAQRGVDDSAGLGDLTDRPVRSLFLGGGTPSLFEPAAIAGLLTALRRRLAIDPAAEITLEANPGTIERGRFADYRAAGITRVSLGAQSFEPALLERLGRIHSAEETRTAAQELHAAGLANFNLDLMYALPGQALEGALADVRAAIALGPAHISHYQLTLEPGTVFGGRPPAGLPDDDLAWEMQRECQAVLAAAGYRQYETSAYARAGAQCAHNLNYWRFGDYLGAGAGAHGKLTRIAPGAAPAAPPTITRTVREREPRRYLARGHQGAPTLAPVQREELPFEFMMNALRLVDGFAESLYESRTGLPWPTVAAKMERLAARGLVAAGRAPSAAHIEETGLRHWRPTGLGQRFLNDLIGEFLPSRTEA